MKRPIIITLLALSFIAPDLLGQNIEEIISTLEIDTLLNNGTKDNRINIAFSNVDSDAYTPYASQQALNTDINELLTYFDATGPNAKLGFSQYRNFFNIYSVWFPQPLTYVAEYSYFQTAQGIRDSLFLPWADEQHGWITMMYAFDGGGGGGAGVVREKRVGDALVYGLDWETILHEFNHTMAGLYDEYTASGIWSNFVCVDGPNVTGQGVIDEIPWRKWIAPETPFPTPYDASYFNKVGVFEGNISGFFGCYRPTAQSCYMGAGGFGEGFGQDMCPVCLQRFITMLYQYVNVIENPLPASPQIEINGSETLSFSADIIKPEPNTQKYEWFVNGKLFASGIESIEVNFNACDSYEVELVVTDTTSAVKFDEKFKDIYPEPKQSHTWTIVQNAVSSYNLAAQTTIIPADCQGLDNGMISVEASGGLAPYSFTLDGTLRNNPIDNMAPGHYSLVVTDANGCSVYEEIELLQDTLLDFEICSNYVQGAWHLSASILSGDDSELNYLWSNGSAEDTMVASTEGVYSLEITNASACSLSKDLTISPILSPLSVNHSVSHSVNGANNGAIYLEIYDGLKPYDISWYKGQIVDLTFYDAARVLSSGIGVPDQIPDYHKAVNAFDDDISYGYDFWAEIFNGNNFLGFDFVEPTLIEVYSITSNVDVPDRDAKSWILQGSDDGEIWSDIDTVTDFAFTERLQTFEFVLGEPATFRYFRLFFTEKKGMDFDNWIAIQQIEIGKFQNEELVSMKNKKDIQHLSPGYYSYLVNDVNRSCRSKIIEIVQAEADPPAPVMVNQDGFYQVKIENPDPDIDYYWMDKNDGGNLLHIGTDFQPESPGQYYVRPYIKSISGFGEEIKGFAVTMAKVPQVAITIDGLMVIDPVAGCEYIWYDRSIGGLPVHAGNEFTPASDGYYYVSTRKEVTPVDPIDPADIPGITLWMDASDLDGNGITDQALPSSSAYKWKFRLGGEWNQDGWFPYRGNYQNGLGIVDFATMWFQYVNSTADKMRTIILAYEESSFSFPKTAPIYSLKQNIPRHSDASQLFSNDAPATTLNGKTYLNGKQVDPLTEDNPMEFTLLSVVFSELVTAEPFASDENWEGKFGELITWDVELTEEQIQGVNAFMQKKWLSTADLESPRIKVAWGENLFEDKDRDGFNEDVDCDDENPNINPDAIEICDGIDNNCDGIIDDGLTSTFYADKDNDGFGDISSPIQACEMPEGFVTDDTDCDDENANINPGAMEICDGIDNNCDGIIDDGLTSTFYADQDNDGFGDILSPIQACEMPEGYVADDTDCDDENANINPVADDIPNNGIDENCDGEDLQITGLHDLNEKEINVYPNPVHDYLYIDLDGKQDFTIQVYSLVGLKILEGRNLSRIELGKMGKGIYLLHIIDDSHLGKNKTVRVIVN